MKPYHIFSVLISIMAMTMMSLSMNAAVPYTEEADVFIGTWISPKSYYETEKQIKIARQGEYLTLRWKQRPCHHHIEKKVVDDKYVYVEVKNLTFKNGIFSWEVDSRCPGVYFYYSLQFKRGELILQYHSTIPKENSHVYRDYIMYPKDDF